MIAQPLANQLTEVHPQIYTNISKRKALKFSGLFYFLIIFTRIAK